MIPQSYSESRYKPMLLVLLSTGIAISVWGFYEYRLFYHDDAFISLRYLQNLAAGNGLVWNPGERVEGYTNFLFIILTGLISTTGPSIKNASQVLGVLSFVGLLMLTWSWGGKIALAKPWAVRLIPVLLIGTSMPMIIWSRGGLETVFLAFLATSAVVACHGPAKPAVSSGILFALACMTRPDAILMVAATGLFLISRTDLNFSSRIGSALRFSGAFALVYTPYFAWRLWYYNDLLPNTFYVKSGFGLEKLWRGTLYVGDFVLTPPYTLIVLVGLLGWLAYSRRGLSPFETHLLLVVCFSFAFTVYVGGDHMPAFRFLVPTIPCAALLAYSLSTRWIGASETRAVIVCAVVVLLGVSQAYQAAWAVTQAHRPDAAALIGAAVGNHIAENWPEDTLIAVNTAGSTPFHSPRHQYVDMLGLTDRHIARTRANRRDFLWAGIPGHEKGDGRYVLSRKPDYVIIGPAEGTTVDDPWFLSDVEISEDPQFRRDFRKKQVILDLTSYPGHRLVHTRNRILFTYYERIPKRDDWHASTRMADSERREKQ